jgi:hypothetical protein
MRPVNPCSLLFNRLPLDSCLGHCAQFPTLLLAYSGLGEKTAPQFPTLLPLSDFCRRLKINGLASLSVSNFITEYTPVLQ